MQSVGHKMQHKPQKEQGQCLCCMNICMITCVPVSTYTVVCAYVSHVVVLSQRHVINVIMGFRKHTPTPHLHVVNFLIYSLIHLSLLLPTSLHFGCGEAV